MIAGGDYGNSSVEVLTGDLGTKQLSNLPERIIQSSMFLHNGTIFLCGGIRNLKKCLQLDHGTWRSIAPLMRKEDSIQQ